MSEKTLITGAGGFIGGALLRALAPGEAALLTSRPREGFRTIDPRMDGSLYGFTKADVGEGFDTVIHLGGFTPKSGAEANDIEGSASNITNTLHLIRTLPTPRRLVFASTLDVYGAAPPPISEASPTLPLTLYGQSKLFCERMLEAWAKETGAELQILRIGHIYGPGEEAYRKLIPTVIRNLLAGEAPTIGSTGAELRSFLYVDDAVRMIVEAARRVPVNGPINVVSGEAASVLSIAGRLCAIHEARTGQAIAPIVKGESGGTVDLTFDATRLHGTLGTASVSLEDGLAAEYDHFRTLTP